MGIRSYARTLGHVLCLLGLLSLPNHLALGADPSVAFYYGNHAPLDELKAFDVVVVEPDHGYDPQAYRSSNSELFAYVSLGEFTPSRSYAREIPDSWVLGSNTQWDSSIIDQRQNEWASFAADRIIGPLWKQGYRGFFLDTLDSYHLVAHTPEQKAQQEHGLAKVIQSIKGRYPEVKLILNRGFEILPTVAEHTFAVAAESLFRGWDQGRARYIEVSEVDRQWLLEQLLNVQRTYQLPVIAIDYLPPHQRQAARNVARHIQHLGIIPWVSTPQLDMMGIGALEVMPRKVLTLFDGAHDPDPEHSDLHRFLDFPLNHLGYIPEHRDVRSSLPDSPLIGRYAGIVLWVSGDRHPWSQRLYHWLLRQKEQGLPIVMFDSFGLPLEERFLSAFQLQLGTTRQPTGNVRFSIKDPRIGYEIQPIPKRREFVPITTKEGMTILQVETESGQQQDVISITPWGGYALSPYTVIQLPGLEHSRWVFDPIQFLQDTLRLPSMPVPDTTTHNGRRILLTHIDGDGFPSLAEFPGNFYAGEVLYREILQKYRIPTTVSVIEGEVGSTGLYPNISKRFEKTVRAMFALDHVEIASHSYSHPLNWREFVISGPNRPGDYNLNIPNYVYGPESLSREIQGSIEYINAHLAPPNKRVQVFLWTGDCDPDEEAVGLTYEMQVGNMNGGDTIMTKENKSLTAVTAFGIKKGEHFQIYAPNQNENLYTHRWTGPFYGFERVIETFELTDRPRRLKPINIYFHTYSGSKKASLNALHRVYRWALSQKINPIYASDYIQRIHDFNRVVVAKAGETWNIRGAQQLRELRVPISAGYPDLSKSVGVTGYSDHESHRYIHLNDPNESIIQFSPKPAALPYLRETNGEILAWARTNESIHLTIKSYLPLVVSLGNTKHCQVLTKGTRVKNRQEGKVFNLFVEQRREKPISLTCS
ncbi:MAG: bifunctional glycoside hydrolase 114/ polysaccharide deacetylase family protein [Nitrospirales bacterium]|nr:bifunctional glycoside hydrolase 114/ polysaccharide deacetylase family protein [Nitrospira sp.]MDR4502699.1 bifunctional glycoside hydrolase 114/ polysaccharide deacetylase family protein [Nitrospirales bacterium]